MCDSQVNMPGAQSSEAQASELQTTEAQSRMSKDSLVYCSSLNKSQNVLLTKVTDAAATGLLPSDQLLYFYYLRTSKAPFYPNTAMTDKPFVVRFVYFIVNHKPITNDYSLLKG